ncbi:MAG: deaminase [Bacillota bacterium]
MSPKTVVAMIGSFGSGCSYIADHILGPMGYERVSLSDYVKREHRKSVGKEASCRSDLQDVGTSMRRMYGADYLATLAGHDICASECECIVVDSIRNPGEIHYLKDTCPRMTVIGVYAPADVRWDRIRQRYSDDRRRFIEDDARDGDEQIPEGQRVTACFLEADYVIDNSIPIADLAGSMPGRSLSSQVQRCLDLVSSRGCYPPSDDESLMAVAYATGQRSRCMKRRVGAIIVDELGHILSSGYNDVPASIGKDEQCREKFNKCHRDQIRDLLSGCIREVVADASTSGKVNEIVWNNLRVLDKCRALHAEERAILNAVKSGVRIGAGCRMFATTFPCNLCANKIAEIGLSQVVYSEPYPVPESAEILDKAGVKHLPFSGVTFNGYFRLLGGMPNANVP